MQLIPMCLPQLFDAGYDPAEKQKVKDVLGLCLDELRSLDPRVDLSKGGDRELVYRLPAAFDPNSDLDENAAALEPLLICLAGIDLIYRRYHPDTDWLYENPVYYARTVVWDSTPALYARGFGDCKSLACTRVAEYWSAGIESSPCFRFLPPNLNPKRNFAYHILDLGPYGWEDPSKIKGMGADENKFMDGTLTKTAQRKV